MVLSGCVPLSETSDPPAAPSPTKSITVNYSGLHYVHFTVNDLNVSADKTIGFLLTPTDSSPSKAEAETKKGYITRKFTAAKKSRDVFMFLHEGTAYELASGSTDIPFVDEATASDTNFETTDILQENTSYKIRVYDEDTILEKTFTTKSFSDGETGSEGLIAYMGGLVKTVVLTSADRKVIESERIAISVAVPLKIERKPEEIMLIPYATDTAKPNRPINYYENNTLRGGCGISGCGTALSGVYFYALKLDANTLASTVFIASPERKVTQADYWSGVQQSTTEVVYHIKIISE
ncbi:hypothetical protein P0082_08960 [Candidatus Haliotispira prima]|uniref:Lipoprotein n=1 Tax=Candidatus Haliotispira prima TaxID=3034016 RepID=A0ABY8MFG8_9SPIO|nr:hypothetical protein P0082_08960 [Candidatus Haliotispira prima]